MSRPKITFGIIVLNGEPFTRYCIRQLYPFAHQIIVVEGASPAAGATATPLGHSSDGTLDTLRDLKENEDPEGRLIIVTAEDEGHPDGFWPGEKHEQSQAYAKRASGEYLWQVDIDEFYRQDDIETVMGLLAKDPGITAASFKTITFWGGFSYKVDGSYLRKGGEVFRRLFKWGPGYRYATHRPPTVHAPDGRDVSSIKVLSARSMEDLGIYLYHYALVFPKQVREKCSYYDHAPWIQKDRYRQWAQDNFFNLRDPFRVHNVYDEPSWLERFHGEHPVQVNSMVMDIVDSRSGGLLRETDDIEALLGSRTYALRRVLVKARCSLAAAAARLLSSQSLWIRYPLALARMIRRRFT